MPLIGGISEAAHTQIQEFNTIRGGHLSSFAQCEFILARFLSRARHVAGLNLKLSILPFKSETRASKWIEAFKETAALADFRDQGVRLGNRFQDEIDLRNYFAHGFARFDAPSQTWTIRRFIPTKSNSWNEGQITLHVDDLHPVASRIGLLTQELLGFTMDLNKRFDMEI